MATRAEIVRKRAKYRCEYCRAPEEVTGYAFHIERIHPRDKGGKNELGNCALSCMPCNRAKSNHVTGEDPQTGKHERLFNPRNDKWNHHFRIEKKIYVRGKNSRRASDGKPPEIESGPPIGSA